MRLRWILCLTISSELVSIGDCNTNKMKADMAMDSTKEQVAQHLDVFLKGGEIAELRTAANLIEGINLRTIPVPEDRQAARTAKLNLWLTLLDTIDSAKDPKFDPANVPATKVTIPAGTRLKPGYLIPTPEAIADPEARRKYDEAVAANTAKTKSYRIQNELRQLDLELTSRSDVYIKKAHPKSPESVKEMDAAIAGHIHNAERAAHLRSLVTP